MILTWPETCRLLAVSPFEALVSLLSWLAFSILLCLKLEEIVTMKWSDVFIPLFISLAISTYLNIIVIARRLRHGSDARPLTVIFSRHMASFITNIIILVTEIYVVRKLDQIQRETATSYTQLFVPLYSWFTILVIFYCAGCNRHCP